MPASTTTPLSIDALRSAVRGEVIAPGDADYDTARLVKQPDADVRQPAAIVRVADAEDIATVVRIAAETGSELAIRGGGHSAAGFGTSDGGIVIDLGRLKKLDVDVEGGTAWAEAGLSAGEVTTALAEKGLAVGFGDTGSVGIGGITLGGGVGYLVRKYGLTIDNLLAADIVTADGQTLRVDADTHPDLFWAIRGGGGNFGVVTRFQYRLVELGQVMGGMLILPATADTISGFMAAAASAPEELSAIANVMPCPPMPFVPEERHGEIVIMALMTCVGPIDEAKETLAAFRSLATPIADQLRPISYPERYFPEDESYRPTAIARTMMIDHVDRPVAETILEYLDASDSPMRAAQLRPLGGAMARVPADATAYAHRSSPIMVNIATFVTGPDDRARSEAWVADFCAALNQGDDAAYVNFLAAEGPERFHAAYPHGTYERLARIKATYDPTNLFRLNQNVPPASS
jgi:hypothetical protein